jgi:hypothetical protein
MYNRDIVVNTNEENTNIFSSILFYLGISKQEIITNEYGNLGNPDIASIEETIRFVKGLVHICIAPQLPSDKTYNLSDWVAQNKDFLDSL